MAALTTVVSTITPKAYESYAKYAVVTRTDTTAFKAFILPKTAIIVGMYVLGQAVSNAGTTATVNAGSTTAATEFLSAYNVLAAATGQGYNPVSSAMPASIIGKQLTVDTPFYAKYAETGTASSSGGPWIIKVEYIIPGPGEKLYN